MGASPRARLPARVPMLGLALMSTRTLAMAFALMVAVVPASASVAALAQPAFDGGPEIAAHAVAADTYPERRVVFPDDVVGLPDLTYATLPGFRPLTLDLYLPDAMPAPAGGFPLVVHIHGGGWMAGHARQSGAFADFPEVLASLAAKGYVVASVNYRLSGEARSPAAVLDVKTAIRWLRANAGTYHIDPTRAVVWGGSAGGHLAGLVAVTCDVEAFSPDVPAPAGAVDPEGRPVMNVLPPELAPQSDCVQGAVTWYGAFDFITIAEQLGVQDGAPALGPEAAFLGCDITQCPPGLAAGASSTTYVDAKDPPMLLVHGTDDATIPYQQSQEMAERLGAAGVPVELMIISGVGHGFVGKTAEATRAASLKALSATFDFIDRTMGDQAPRGQIPDDDSAGEGSSGAPDQ